METGFYGNPQGWCSISELLRAEFPYLLLAQRSPRKEQFLKPEERLLCAIWELQEVEGLLQLTGREPGG